VDLGKLNMQQLLEAGVVNIDRLDDCTSCKNSLFYSYRVEKEHTGRHSAIASLI
jgi:copper oxidase (laccase) domain-containing protein